MDRCDGCGFVYDDLPVADVPGALRSFGPSYGERLVDGVAAVREHPIPGVWSALEYACHVRDVLQVQRERVALAMAEECPELTPMGRDERVVRDRYNEQDPVTVAAELDDAARAFADSFAALTPSQLERVAIYSWPSSAERTMAWVGRHTVHEGIHHLLDVDRVLAAATLSPS